MNFVRGIDPKNAMKIGASQTLIPQMIQKFVESNSDIIDVFIFDSHFITNYTLFCICARKRMFMGFRIRRSLKKTELKKYITFSQKKPHTETINAFYYQINPEHLSLFPTRPVRYKNELC